MKKYFSYFITASMLLSVVATSCNKEKDEAVVYYATDSFENTFWQNGKILIPNTSEISLLDFDLHGNIVAAGYTMIGGGKHHLTIAKINDEGFLDNSIGNNWLTKVADYDSSMPYGLKVTKENKIVVLGSFTKVQFQGYKTIMMQFNEDGTVDESYGDNGKVNLNFNTGSIMSLNFDNDDFMLIAKGEYGTIENNGVLYSTLTGYSISKYNYTGELDKSFGKDGVVYLTNSVSPRCMKILKNGSIIVAGTYNTWPNTELGFCRLTPNGELDKKFADDGIWHKNMMQDFDLDCESFSNILEDNDGNLVLSGSGLTNGMGWGNRAFLSKFSSAGKLDTNFGQNGFYCFDFGGSNKPIFQVGNKYITAGWQENHQIVSVHKDGASAYGVYNCELYYVQDMKLQGNSKIILGGGYKSENAIFALERVILD